MRVGESARRDHRTGAPTNFVFYLRDILETLGITVIDPEDDAGSERVSRQDEGIRVAKTKNDPRAKRRVSFDDARLEETWLSENSKSIDPAPEFAPRGLLRRPPRRGRGFASLKRARSTSSQRDASTRYPQHPSSRHRQHFSSSTTYDSDYEERAAQTDLFQPSQTQLEQNAEAFFATSELRNARQRIHIWQDKTADLRNQRSNAFSIATAHDNRTLVKQALDMLRSAFETKRLEKNRKAKLQRILEDFLRKNDRWLLVKAFSHWDESARHQKRATALAQRHIMKVKYFNRWRKVAVDNVAKTRKILARKYLNLWRDKTTRHQLAHEQALTHYEETLAKKTYHQWFWTFCSRRVEDWHERRIESRAFKFWLANWRSRQDKVQEVSNSTDHKLVKSAFSTLILRAQKQKETSDVAQSYRQRKLATSSLKWLGTQAKLVPRSKTISAQTDRLLQHKVIKVWQLHLNLNRQAEAVDRKRLLQTAWTSWNDALRCQALAQRIDERVLVQTLYKWVLHERLRVFEQKQRTSLLRKSLATCFSNFQERSSRLFAAETSFVHSHRWRGARSAILQLNAAIRHQETEERTAVEFANTWAIPKAFGRWKERIEDARRLATWAADARFYCLCTRVLKLWQEKTTKQKQNRRREAYATIRAKVKIRIVQGCFTRWQTKTANIQTMQSEADQREQARRAVVGTQAFAIWRDESRRLMELQMQAAATDQQKLLASALATLVGQYADLTEMEQEAAVFRQETDSALLSRLLKKVQWAIFTATRRIESADALLARNRDQHIRAVLRHWSSQVVKRRSANTFDDQVAPDSPSLRPASRLAAKSAEGTRFAGPTPQHSTEVAMSRYLRTPAPSRRTGRFRALPTPIHMTPMAFDPSLFAKTPAPLDTVISEGDGEEPHDVTGLDNETMPQVTPFARKLNAGDKSFAVSTGLRSSILERTGFGVTPRVTNRNSRFPGSNRFPIRQRR